VIADRTAYDVGFPVLANYRTDFCYKLTKGWYAVYAHDPIKRVEFMNAPKRNPLKRDWPKLTKSVNNSR